MKSLFTALLVFGSLQAFAQRPECLSECYTNIWAAGERVACLQNNGNGTEMVEFTWALKDVNDFEAGYEASNFTAPVAVTAEQFDAFCRENGVSEE